MNGNKTASALDKKSLVFTIIALVLIFIITIAMALSDEHNRFDYKNNSRIFNSTSDLAFLDEYIVEENIKLDKNIFDAYEAYFSENKTVLLEYNGNKIYLFAYTFSNTDCCLEYANKVSGNNYKRNYDGNSISRYYYKTVSLLNIYQSRKLLVFQNNKAYVISAKISEKDFTQFVEYFMSQLPTKVEITY